MSRKVKSVAFNLDDPFEVDLFMYSQQYPNFSKFVKRLIQNHINGVSPNQTSHQDEQIIQVEETENNPMFDADLIKNFL